MVEYLAILRGAVARAERDEGQDAAQFAPASTVPPDGAVQGETAAELARWSPDALTWRRRGGVFGSSIESGPRRGGLQRQRERATIAQFLAVAAY